ncbi:histidine phosphatase family protein [Chloroflexota bacterium]
MPRIILVRHGETDWNTEGRIQAQLDTPLNEAGRQQAALVADRLAEQPCAAIYSSDLSRAHETAQIINTHHNLPITTDERLRELDYGRWTGLTFAEIKALDGAQAERWWRGDLNANPHGGETLMDVDARIGVVLAELRANHAGQTVLVVSHGGPLCQFICRALDLPPEKRWHFRFGNTGITELWHRNGVALLERANDTAHLLNHK